MRPLSKSRLIDFLQCPKRLWLQVHRPELAIKDEGAQKRMEAGNRVGELARRLFDAEERGILFDAQTEGYEPVFARSAAALRERRPLFEAGFRAGSIFAFVDVLLPNEEGDAWRLIEVKSSSKVKDYQRADLAIQVHILRSAGLQLSQASIACIDSSWTYEGGGDYQGLFKTSDLLEEAIARQDEVIGWEFKAQQVIAGAQSPEVPVGSQCSSPFACPFTQHCRVASGLDSVEAPVEWIPDRKTRALIDWVKRPEVTSMQDVPDQLLNEVQRRVKAVTVSGQVWTDPQAARSALSGLQWPLHFLDFEAVQFVIPQWPGTKPFQQIPFQYSLHTLHPDGELSQAEFLNLSGKNPSRQLAEKLINDLCSSTGTVLAYNAAFEGMILKQLASEFTDLATDLSSIKERLVDLLPLTKRSYYHPDQKGSWSIKAVLPTLAGAEGYESLDGVSDGQAAVSAYLEAIDPKTGSDRRLQLDEQLRRYCSLDTAAMVRLTQFLLSL